jgi:hypothetical protein
MKKFLLSLSFIVTVVLANAQLAKPIKWSYSSKKIADKEYEVVITASIQSNWHLYSQTQPANAVNMPTIIKFNSNPLVKLDGKTKEAGKLEFFEDKKLKISANQYANKVVFTQKVKLKAKTKTNISGTIDFQTCDDKKCLPPATETFKISLQ